MSFLAPLGDYNALASFCGLKSLSDDFAAAVAAAEAEVVAQCGPVLAEAVTDVLEAASATQVLSARVASLTSVTGEDGTVYPVGDFRARGQILARKDGGTIPAWAVVVYSSGWAQAAIPAPVLMAGKLLARHLWRTQLGNQRVADVEVAPGSAWLWPKQAADLAAPYRLAPLGFA